MRILLCDSSCYSPLNPYFVEPLEDLARERGYEFQFVDEADYIPAGTSLAARAFRKIPGNFWSIRGRRSLNKRLIAAARCFKPQLFLTVNGKFIAPSTLQLIGDTGAVLANYATDDPWNPLVTTPYFRDGVRLYHIYATPKKAVIPQLKDKVKIALRTPFAFKPSIHFPDSPDTLEDKLRFTCDVAFIGSCDADRIDYFHTLIREAPDVRVHIYGAGHWERYPALRPFLKGAIYGRAFRFALASAKIALNFIRHANRDDHSERAFQIPACGAFMLSERTDEQVKLFADGYEAAYFDSPNDLVRLVRYYLANESERTSIQQAGHRRVMTGRNTCKDRLLDIISAAARPDCP